MIFFYRLHNIYALFALEYAYLVACVHEQDNCEKYAAKGTHFGMQGIFPVLNAHLICLTELVLVEQLFFAAATSILIHFIHLFIISKN